MINCVKCTHFYKLTKNYTCQLNFLPVFFVLFGVISVTAIFIVIIIITIANRNKKAEENLGIKDEEDDILYE